MWHQRDSFVCKPLPLDKKKFDNPDNDPRGLWKADPFDAPHIRPNLTYPIINPNTGEQHLPPSGRHWRISEQKFSSALSDGRIVWTNNGKGRPQLKVFYEEKKEFGSIDNSWFSAERIGTSTNGTKELIKILGDAVFDTPKPTSLLRKLIALANVGKNDVILDFFSGSATTAHAVMNFNAEDGGNRRFILETTPMDSEARKAGYENICEIGKERIRRAGEKVKAECEDEERTASLDIGFKVFKLDSSNLQKWQPQPEDLPASLQESMDNFLPDRTNLDVVYEIALKLGLDLSYEVEEREADGQTIYVIGAGALMICLASPISMKTAEALLKLHEEYEPETWQVVFRDTGFLSDQEKTNIKETLKGAGLDEDAFISI